jgi:type II secretory pathway component PulK
MLKGSMHRRQRQGGVAVVTALLITALAVTLVTDLFWQQQVALHGLEGQRLRLETRQALRSALDGAMLVLRDAGAVQGRVTTLDGAWARGGDHALGGGARLAMSEDEDGAAGADAQIAQHTADSSRTTASTRLRWPGLNGCWRRYMSTPASRGPLRRRYCRLLAAC